MGLIDAGAYTLKYDQSTNELVRELTDSSGTVYRSFTHRPNAVWYAQKTSDTLVTNSTVLVNVSDWTGIPIEASKNYTLIVALRWSGQGGLKWKLNSVPTGVTGKASLIRKATYVSNITSLVTNSDNNHTGLIFYQISTGTTVGTFDIQAAQLSATATPINIQDGSVAALFER